MSTLDHDLLSRSSAPSRAEGRVEYRDRVVRHPVFAFFVFTYAFSWLLWTPPALGLGGPLGTVLIFSGVFGPAIAAATITRLTGRSLRVWLRELVRFRAAPRWYAALLGFPIVLVAATSGAFVATGGTLETSLLAERVPAYLPLLVVWSLAGAGEEPGWRGFALPRLQEALTPVRATVVLGVLWALWHLPLLAAADEPSHGLRAFPLLGVTLLMLAAIVGYAFLYTFLWNRTRNVWLAILLHGSFTAAIGAFLLLPSEEQVGTTYAHLQLLTVLVLAVAVIALVLATRGRLGLVAEEASQASGRLRRGRHARLPLVGVLALLALGVSAAAGSAAPAGPPGSATLAQIDSFVEKQIDARRVPGFALAIVSGNEVVHQRGFGSADRAGKPVTVDTPFVLGSTTKSFTALAVMQLVDAGKVSLDAPVGRYVPELTLAGGAERRITIRQLLHQTSGLPALAGGRLLRSVGDGTLEDAVRELDGTQLSAAPGAQFEYANANYVLLGLVIERASGEAYGDYVQRHIFEPLAMSNSFASVEAARVAGLAVGHRYWFGFRVAHGPTSPDAIRPAGYLMSSAADMGRYLAMYLNGGILDGRRIVSRQALETMLAPAAAGELGPWADGVESRYAMGWFVGGPWQEAALLHPGRDPDSIAMIVLLPRQGLAVVTLANASLELPLPGGTSSLQRISRGVVSLLVGGQPSTGIGFTRFYVVFDAVVVLILAALVWSLVRVLRQRHHVSRGARLIGRGLRAVAEVGTGMLLLAVPVLVGQSWAGAMLWTPDLALVLLAASVLLILTGGLRATAQILARRGAAPMATSALPHSGVAGPRRTRYAAKANRRHAPGHSARRRVRQMRGAENDASARNP